MLPTEAKRRLITCASNSELHCLFEFNDYKSSHFEFLTEVKYNELKKVYVNTNDDVNIILNMVYELANSHAYSSINENGKEEYNMLALVKEILARRIQTHDENDYEIEKCRNELIEARRERVYYD